MKNPKPIIQREQRKLQSTNAKCLRMLQPTYVNWAKVHRSYKNLSFRDEHKHKKKHPIKDNNHKKKNPKIKITERSKKITSETNHF